MTTPTKRDALDAAMSIAEDIAAGRLNPAALADRAASECRELFGTVVGPGDLAWAVQCDVAALVVAHDVLVHSAGHHVQFASPLDAARRAREGPMAPPPAWMTRRLGG